MSHVNATLPLRTVKRIGIIITLGLTAQLGIGCASSGNLAFPNFANKQTVAADATGQTKKIVIAQVIGAPPKVAKSLTSALTKAAQTRQLAIAEGKDATGDYSVRGYLVASPDKKGTKLSYIWDITDSSGKRAHRIKGEELISTKKLKKGADPWSEVSDKAIESIATKTAARLATWLPTQNKPAMVADNKAADKKAKPKTTQVAKASKPAVKKIAAKKKAAAKPKKMAAKQAPKRIATGSTTAKKKAAAPAKVAKTTPATPAIVMAMVPTVHGAPGDGQTSLTMAIKKQLNSRGIKLSGKTTQATYTVQGAVKLTPASQTDKQDIAIEWQVIDPNGRKLGTVSQRNSIPKGSLNGPWGKTADAAAAAAADGILKLLPKTK